MRDRGLHHALRAFASEAAAHLAGELERGAELRFELAESPGPGSTLYRYRALTAMFITERWGQLVSLPSFDPAVRAFGGRAEAYLRVRGAGGTDAASALRALLERLFEEGSGFELSEARFDRAYAEVERVVFERTVRMVVVAPLHGLELDGERMPLGDGLALTALEALDDPPAELLASARLGRPLALVVLERDLPSAASLPVTEARMRFRALVSGMRLFKSGRLALGPIAYSRADEGSWRALPLASGGPGRGEPWLLPRVEEAELRAFLDVVGRSRLAGTVGWARARFEMSCERALDAEGLTDLLLALRALLDAGDDAGRASLALRVAALCADPVDRRAVQHQVESALALERFVVGSGSADAYVERIGSDPPRVVVGHIEEHVRALLRDVACGYLGGDLTAAADEILLQSEAFFPSGRHLEITARDLRGEADPDPAQRRGDEPEREDLDWDLGEDPPDATAAADLDFDPVTGPTPPQAEVSDGEGDRGERRRSDIPQW